MNRILVLCLFVSMVVALFAAISALLAGWGWLAALAVYSGTGSFSLLMITLIVQPGADRPAKPKARAAQEARKASVLA